MSNNNNSSGGVGFMGLLTILFIALKLPGKINWSWWWVLSSIWITTLIAMGVAFIWFVAYTVTTHNRRKRLRRRFKDFQESISKIKESR